MYISTGMLALIIIGAFILGIVTPIVFIARHLARRDKSSPASDDNVSHKKERL